MVASKITMADEPQEPQQAPEKTTVETKSLTVEEFLNERVPFLAIKDNDRYKDDISVTVNGVCYQIKRGVHVMIPRFVYNAIMDAERQKGVASMVSQQYEDQYKNGINAM